MTCRTQHVRLLAGRRIKQREGSQQARVSRWSWVFARSTRPRSNERAGSGAQYPWGTGRRSALPTAGSPCYAEEVGTILVADVVKGESPMIRVLRTILFAGLLVILGTSSAVATHGQSDHAVPIRGSVAGADTPPDMGENECTNAGASWRFASSGSGTVSHLGKVNFDLVNCTTVNPDFSLIISGKIKFTAANGDELVITHNGAGSFNPFLPPPPTVPWDITSWQVDRGTGRFAGAQGSGQGHALTHVAQTAEEIDFTEISLNGTIAYDASGRHGQ